MLNYTIRNPHEPRKPNSPSSLYFIKNPKSNHRTLTKYIKPKGKMPIFNSHKMGEVNIIRELDELQRNNLEKSNKVYDSTKYSEDIGISPLFAKEIPQGKNCSKEKPLFINFPQSTVLEHFKSTSTDNSPMNINNVYKRKGPESHIIKKRKFISTSLVEWKYIAPKGGSVTSLPSSPRSPRSPKTQQNWKLIGGHSKLKSLVENYKSPKLYKDGIRPKRKFLNCQENKINKITCFQEGRRIIRSNKSLSHLLIPKAPASIDFRRKTTSQYINQKGRKTSQRNILCIGGEDVGCEDVKGELEDYLLHIRNIKEEKKTTAYKEEIEKEVRDKKLYKVNWEGERMQLMREQVYIDTERGKGRTDINYSRKPHVVRGLSQVGLTNRAFQLSTKHLKTEREGGEAAVSEERHLERKEGYNPERIAHQLGAKYNLELNVKLGSRERQIYIYSPPTLPHNGRAHRLHKALKILKLLGLTPKELLQKGIFPSEAFKPNGVCKLFEAIKEGSEEEVGRILKCNPYYVFSFDNLHQTPLHWAAKRYNGNIMQILLGYHANPNALDIAGRTPLYIAAHTGYICPVKMLLRSHANPHYVSRMNYTADDMTQNKIIQRLIHKAKIFHTILKFAAEKNKDVAWETEGEQLFGIHQTDIDDDQIKSNKLLASFAPR